MEPLFNKILFLHSYLRWLILFFLLFTFFKIAMAYRGKRSFGPTEKEFHLVSMILIDIQFLIGMVLYFQSPLVKALFSDFKTGVKEKEIRFFGMEHLFSMILVLVLIHIANVFSKKDIDPALKIRKMFFFYLGILVILLSGIPWFRALFPGF
jgi:hypothetical protein